MLYQRKISSVFVLVGLAAFLYSAGAADGAVNPAGEFTFAHYNIGTFTLGVAGTVACADEAAYRAKEDFYRKMIAGVGADVWGVCEYTDVFATIGTRTVRTRDALFGDYANAHEGTRRRWSNVNSLFLNGRFSDVKSRETVFRDRVQGRYYTETEASFGGTRILFIETHLDYTLIDNSAPYGCTNGAVARASQFVELVARCAGEPCVVLAADFNVADPSEYEQLRRAGFASASGGAWPRLKTHHAASPRKELDNVFVKGLDILSVRTFGTAQHSDHLGLAVRLRTKNAPAAGPAMTFAPIESVRVEDAFWSPRFELWRTKTIPDVFDKLDQRSHAVSNFVLAASRAKDGHQGCWFFDGLLLEAIRGASDYLLRYPSPELDRRLDDLIAKIAAAPLPDGYLNTRIQIMNPEWRWGDNGGCLLDQHELYNAGCLIEAGVHHYRATGKTKLLATALRFANCLCDTIGPRPKRNLLPGHSLPEAALVDLAHLCREKPGLAQETKVPTRPDEYLGLVKFWFDAHGDHCGAPDFEKLGLNGEQGAIAEVRRMTAARHDAGWRPSWGDYMMDRHALAGYRSIEGHAVRAVLLCEGLAAYSEATGDGATADLATRFWESMVGRKLYVTGGVGADPKFESFSADWVLPPDAYLETCAAIGNAFFSGRMAALTGDGRYMDEFERVIYNALLTAVGEDGVHYTYQNPLNTAKGARWEWHDCPCCPPMFLKLTGALPGYAYSTGRDGVSVNLFLGSTVTLNLAQGKLTLRQKTAYPEDGRVEIAVAPEKPSRFALRVRVPGWARGVENPFGLYRSEGVRPFTLQVNGAAVDPKLDRGYAVLDRTWRKGDRVELTLDVSPRKIRADERVEAVRGAVACARGPVVMAVEEKDDPSYSSFAKAIPYGRVANRGACGHRVWLKE